MTYNVGKDGLMKILHVHKYYHARDGVGRYLFDLMRLLEEAGHITAALAMHDERNAPSVWSEFFVPNLETTQARFGQQALKQLRRSWWSPEAERRMTDMLTAFKPDVIHAHNLYTHLSPSVLAPAERAGVPVIMTVHDYALVSANYTLWGQNGLADLEHLGLLETAKSRAIKGSLAATLVQDIIFKLQRTFKMYDKRIAGYVTLSQFVKDAMIQVGYAADKITVIPPAAGPLVNDDWGSNKKTREGILFAGRLEDYKGLETYLELAALFPKLNFYVAGTGPLESLVAKRAVTLPNLKYLGFLKAQDLWKKMAEVKVVAVPSLWYEPFGLVAIEALAVGTPILTSDRGGLPEIVRQSGGGLIFKAGEVKSAAVMLERLLGPKNWTEFKRAGQSYAKENYAPGVFLSKILAKYEGLISP